MLNIVFIYIFGADKASSCEIKCLKSVGGEFEVFIYYIHKQKLKHTFSIIVLLANVFLLRHAKILL